MMDDGYGVWHVWACSVGRSCPCACVSVPVAETGEIPCPRVSIFLSSSVSTIKSHLCTGIPSVRILTLCTE